MCFPMLLSAASWVASTAGYAETAASLASIGEALTVPAWAATGLQAVGTLAAGAQQAQAANFNAQAAERDAVAARERAAFAEAQTRRRALVLAAQNRANAAASGVQMEGSPLDVLAFNAQQAELDALSTRWQGDAEAAALRSRAGADRWRARNAMTGGLIGAGTAILTAPSAWSRKTSGPLLPAPAAGGPGMMTIPTSNAWGI